MTDEIPLIFTSKGNLPVDSLKYETAWEEAPTENGEIPIYTKFIETYLLDGEIVRQSAHVLHRGGFSQEATTGRFN